MSTIKLLDRPIAYHRCLVPVSGSVTAAVFLSQAIYWANRTTDPEGWFWKTADQWESETGLTRREQETARKQLKSSQVLEEKLVGVPAIMHYRLRVQELETRLAENAKLDSIKAPNLVGGKRQTIDTESTTETTAEIERERASPTFPSSSKEADSLIPVGAGIPADFIEKVWLQADARGGCDAKGMQIRKWASHVQFLWKCERERLARFPSSHSSSSSSSSKTKWPTAELQEMQDRYDRLHKEALGY